MFKQIIVIISVCFLTACSGKPKLPKPKGPEIQWNTSMQSIPPLSPSNEILPVGTPDPIKDTKRVKK